MNSKRQQIALIDRAYAALDVLNNQVMSPLRDNYFKQNLDEEKGHRHFCPDGVRCGLATRQAARLFAVRQIAQFLNGEKAPEPREWLHLRPSYLTACALVAEYREQIMRAWGEVNVCVADVLALDYAELNK